MNRTRNFDVAAVAQVVRCRLGRVRSALSHARNGSKADDVS
jgi:hypothetical protein